MEVGNGEFEDCFPLPTGVFFHFHVSESERKRAHMYIGSLMKTPHMDNDKDQNFYFPGLTPLQVHSLGFDPTHYMRKKHVTEFGVQKWDSMMFNVKKTH